MGPLSEIANKVIVLAATLETVPSDQCAERRFRSARSLIRIFPERILYRHGCNISAIWTTKTLNRLRGSTGLFESLLGAHGRGYVYSRYGSVASASIF